MKEAMVFFILLVFCCHAIGKEETLTPESFRAGMNFTDGAYSLNEELPHSEECLGWMEMTVIQNDKSLSFVEEGAHKFSVANINGEKDQILSDRGCTTTIKKATVNRATKILVGTSETECKKPVDGVKKAKEVFTVNFFKDGFRYKREFSKDNKKPEVFECSYTLGDNGDEEPLPPE